MEKELKVAVVGFGGMGMLHAGILNVYRGLSLRLCARRAFDSEVFETGC